jgi:hypothetical protein
MSQYGTTADYCNGYDDGADETCELYGPLVKAARALSKRWSTGKNLSEQIQALDRALQALPCSGRLALDSTAHPGD